MTKTTNKKATRTKPRPWTDKDKADLVSMFKEGKTHAEIAEALGRTEAAIGFAKGVFAKGTATAKPVERAKRGLPARMGRTVGGRLITEQDIDFTNKLLMPLGHKIDFVKLRA